MVGVRWLPALAAAVLALSAFNLTFRLGSEGLTEWDESLYATSALEMVRNQEWVATTFDGVIDYSNSKPPLNVWLLALSMQVFGVSLVSLRLVSIVASALTILVFSSGPGVASALPSASSRPSSSPRASDFSTSIPDGRRIPMRCCPSFFC